MTWSGPVHLGHCNRRSRAPPKDPSEARGRVPLRRRARTCRGPCLHSAGCTHTQRHWQHRHAHTRTHLSACTLCQHACPYLHEHRHCPTPDTIPTHACAQGHTRHTDLAPTHVPGPTSWRVCKSVHRHVLPRLSQPKAEPGAGLPRQGLRCVGSV